jgi:uncharacterized protein
MKIMVTGGTGFIGSALIPKLLNEKYRLVLLTRNPEKTNALYNGAVEAIGWDAENDPLPEAALSDTDVLVHLVGENIASGRWTESLKKKIYDSRIHSGERISASLKKREKPLPLVVSASAIGIYGNGGDNWLNENSPHGTRFLAKVCVDWEASLRGAAFERGVFLRLGVVLGNAGGALEKMLPIFKAGLGGRIGSGKQWMSWIHRDDACSLILYAIKNPKMNGAYNAVAPHPVTNEEFTHELGSALHRPAVIPVPEFALRLAFGEMAEDTLLTSQRVSSERTLATGFEYRYPNLTSALKSIL